MDIKEIAIEVLSGKELRTKTARVKDDGRYLVWIIKVESDLQPTVSGYPKVGFIKK